MYLRVKIVEKQNSIIDLRNFHRFKARFSSIENETRKEKSWCSKCFPRINLRVELMTRSIFNFSRLTVILNCADTLLSRSICEVEEYSTSKSFDRH